MDFDDVNQIAAGIIGLLMMVMWFYRARRKGTLSKTEHRHETAAGESSTRWVTLGCWVAIIGTAYMATAALSYTMIAAVFTIAAGGAVWVGLLGLYIIAALAYRAIVPEK